MSSTIVNKGDKFAASYDELVPLLSSYGPESLKKVRERAIRQYSEFGIPTTKDEEFRYIPLRHLEEKSFIYAYGATVDRHEVAKTSVGEVPGARLTFVNGQFAPELVVHEELPEGVFIGNLMDGYLSHSEVLDRHLTKVATLKGKLGTTNDERFVALNTAFMSEGAFVYIPRGVQVETPIHLLFLQQAEHGDLVAYPRVLIVLEEGASAKVVESYIGTKGTYFVNAVTEVVVGDNANLELIKVQEETAKSTHIATVAAVQGKGSVWTHNNFNFGGHIVRNDINVDLQGEHTESWLNAANLGFDDQVVDNHTRIDHAVPNCNSFEVYKSILGDRAVGVFNGKIFVYEDAQKTDAKQTNQALLLSKHATINTKPQLEIFADDVKCTHGATIGQLREDALFYLRSRGVPKKEAQSLLVYAFAAEVIEKVGIQQLREKLEEMLYSKLGSLKENPAAVVEE